MSSAFASYMVHNCYSMVYMNRDRYLLESDVIRFLLKERIAEKEFQEKRRITLDEVSKETDISRNTLSRIANTYGYNTSTDILDRLCTYFGCASSGIIEHIADAEEGNT